MSQPYDQGGPEPMTTGLLEFVTKQLEQTTETLCEVHSLYLHASEESARSVESYETLMAMILTTLELALKHKSWGDVARLRDQLFEHTMSRKMSEASEADT